MKKFVSILMAAAMLLSLCALTACGSKTAEPAAEEEVTEAEVAEAVGDLVLVNEGKLTMSTNAAFPPYELTADDGSFEGIDVEIATAIAEKLGLELQIDDMEFDSALMAVQQGKSDIIMAGVTVTPERQEVMDFSDSYSTGVQVVIVPENSDITLENLADLTIGVQRATTGYIYCSGEFGEDHVVAFDNGIAATQALVNGQVDCVVIDSAPAQEFVNANEGLTILETPYTTEDYAIGMAKGNTVLVEAVNSALAELKADGTIQAILDKYIAAE